MSTRPPRLPPPPNETGSPSGPLEVEETLLLLLLLSRMVVVIWQPAQMPLSAPRVPWRPIRWPNGRAPWT